MPNYRDYWDRNIDKWGEFYLDNSHSDETLNGPRWFSGIYKATIGRVEAKLMRERFAITSRFIEQHVRGTFADVGCGTGIFTVHAMKQGAKVIAIDFSESSLKITERNVKSYATGDVTYLQMDVQKSPIPECDVALAMGVTSNIQDLESFLGNILPHTKILCCQYTDPARFSNRIRTLIPALNVRNLIFHSQAKVDAIYRKNNSLLVDRMPFATGFIDIVFRSIPVSSIPGASAF